MRRAIWFGAAVGLTACSGGGGSGEPAQNERAAVAASVPAAPPTASEQAAPAPADGLRGQVSSLTGAVSGLNTRVSDMGLIIDLPADALFEFDKAELTASAEAQLAKAADLIRRSPAGPIQVIGHTDAKGDDAYNQKLSEARARTVADWFGQQVGVRTRQFQVLGKGETSPIAPNARPDGGDDAAGRAKNRRVEVVVPMANDRELRQ